jgi:hypothetical protein
VEQPVKILEKKVAMITNVKKLAMLTNINESGKVRKLRVIAKMTD